MAFLKGFRDFLVSLKLTVVLLVLSIILVFAATLDQVQLGVWGVQEKYFHSLFVFARFGEMAIPVFPGGYLIGGVLLANLLSAHLSRLRPTWRKAGIWLVHSGLILLLVGELLSGIVQQEFQMRLEEGETKNFAESDRLNELAIIDTTDPKTDLVVAIPEKLLAEGRPVQSPVLPFRVIPKAYYPNSDLQRRAQVPGAPPSPATQGYGTELIATPLALTYKENERNLPTAFFELIGPEGSLGTWMAADLLTLQGMPPQRFEYGGRSWKLALRPARDYQPYSLTLLKFSHDIYPGTDIPKNFSSRVRITAPGVDSGREALIYMNNPLRYQGLTFYQASFDPNDDHATVLQVVRNPSWLIPYISCGTIAFGLVLQFLLHLARFATRRNAKAAQATAAA